MPITPMLACPAMLVVKKNPSLHLHSYRMYALAPKPSVFADAKSTKILCIDQYFPGTKCVSESSLRQHFPQIHKIMKPHTDFSCLSVRNACNDVITTLFVCSMLTTHQPFWSLASGGIKLNMIWVESVKICSIP